MHQASALATGATPGRGPCGLVRPGAAIAGGMHHAMAANVALPAGTGDAGWLRAFHAIVPPLLRQFRPQILVSQHGDRHAPARSAGPLGAELDAQRATHAAIRAVAHDLAGGRWLLTGGGGSDLVQVVPRTWMHLLAEAAGQPVNLVAQTPDRWREYVARYTGLTGPEHMTEGHQRSSRSSPAATLLTRSTGPSWSPATPSSSCTD